MTDIICPVWGTPAKIVQGHDGPDGLAVYSERAGGKYFISNSAIARLKSAVFTDQTRVALTHEICDHSERQSIIKITTTNLNQIYNKKSSSFQTRTKRLVKYFISLSNYLGDMIIIPKIGRTSFEPIFGFEYFTNNKEWRNKYIPNEIKLLPLLAWSDSIKIEEISFILDFAKNAEYINISYSEENQHIFALPNGYDIAETLDSQRLLEQVFIAMWFDNSVNSAYEHGIETAVRECGYSPMRIDRKEHLNKIDDEIVAEIKRSQFVVADFTSEPDKPRGGVYFEAGYAMGMGIPVVWTCREDLIGQVHFDTRQFNHIVWKDPTELAEKLKNRILATIGQGPIQK